jgi:hypothetical protein
MRNLLLAVFWAAAIALNIGATAFHVTSKPPNTPAKIEEYILRFKDLALLEQVSNNIPASIKLGQALLESEAGESELAINANNHFGLKCKSCSESEAYLKIDDDRNKKNELVYSKFSRFETAEASFAAHSERLRTDDRYSRLFSYDREDYRSWAYGLKACGYATDKLYAEKLIALIERYNLHRFDKTTSSLSLTEVPENGTPQYKAENGTENGSDDHNLTFETPQYSSENVENSAFQQEKPNKPKVIAQRKIEQKFRTKSQFTTEAGEQMRYTLYEVTLEGENVNVSPRSGTTKKQPTVGSKSAPRKKNVRARR